MYSFCTTYAQAAHGAQRYGAVALTLLVLSACSPGGIVAGTVGVAGAVAGGAVDLVLRSNIHPGELR